MIMSEAFSAAFFPLFVCCSCIYIKQKVTCGCANATNFVKSSKTCNVFYGFCVFMYRSGLPLKGKAAQLQDVVKKVPKRRKDAAIKVTLQKKGCTPMKKQAIIITAALLTLCLTGCSEKKTANETTTTTTAAPAAATALASESTDIAQDTTRVEYTTIVSMPPLPSGRLFGGYVTASVTAALLSDMDENAGIIAHIPAGTQLDIYESGKDGWYMTVYMEKQGYVRASDIDEIPAYDMDDNYQPDVADIAGRWLYQEQKPGSSEYTDENGKYYVIYENGAFISTTDGNTFEYGVINTTYDEHPDGSKSPLFAFLDENGETFMLCAAVAPSKREDGCLYIGNGATARLLPDNGNASAGLLPNEYGFYPYKDPISSSVSVASLTGEWKLTDDSVGGVLVITNGNDIYNGSFAFTDAAGTDTVGCIKLEYTYNPDGMKSFWFTFYTSDDKLWNAFSVSDDMPLNDIYSNQDGALHFRRTENSNASAAGFHEITDMPETGVSVAALTGTWKNADNPAETLSVTNQGELYAGGFTFTDDSGASVSGNIKLEYMLNPDDTKTYWFTFYENDGTLWNAFSVPSDIPLNDIYSGQDGALHFVR